METGPHSGKVTRRMQWDHDQLVSQFEKEGYVILAGVFGERVIRKARDAMEHLVQQRAETLVASGKIDHTFDEATFETRLYRLYETCLDDAPKSFRSELHLPGLFDLFFNPSLLKIVQSFLGDEIRLYPNYTARPKLPDWDGTRVLWHQDGGYTGQVQKDDGAPVADLHMVNAWAPLLPARVENGCMQFIPGTHKLGIVPHLSRTHYLEIAPDHLNPLLPQAVNIELDPGDAVLFHNLLFHSGLPNRAKTIRWSLDWRYQDATQPTLRKEQGHLARSSTRPEAVVKSAEEWARLRFE